METVNNCLFVFESSSLNVRFSLAIVHGEMLALNSEVRANTYMNARAIQTIRDYMCSVPLLITHEIIRIDRRLGFFLFTFSSSVAVWKSVACFSPLKLTCLLSRLESGLMTTTTTISAENELEMSANKVALFYQQARCVFLSHGNSEIYIWLVSHIDARLVL